MDTTTTPMTPRLEWGRAWRALRLLIDDPKRTEQVFEITDALGAKGFERAYQRFCGHPEGRRLLAERPSLLDILSNRHALRALPAGSFGRAYVEFMESGALTAEGLVEAELQADTNYRKQPADPDREYFGNRNRDMHDLWHVLTGYGMDEAGEAANLAFSLAQMPNLGFGLIVGAAAWYGPRHVRWQRYLIQAWRRGQRTTLLTVAPYEQLLPLPLEAVRRRLHIEPANVAHPNGILVGHGLGTSGDWFISPAPPTQTRVLAA